MVGGLGLRSAGFPAGARTETGTCDSTTAVQGGAGRSDTPALTTKVAAASRLPVQTTSLPAATTDQSCSAAPAVAGGSGQGFRISAGRLPSGRRLPATAAISPPAQATFRITVQAVDTAGDISSRQPLTLIVR